MKMDAVLRLKKCVLIIAIVVCAFLVTAKKAQRQTITQKGLLKGLKYRLKKNKNTLHPHSPAGGW